MKSFTRELNPEHFKHVDSTVLEIYKEGLRRWVKVQKVELNLSKLGNSRTSYKGLFFTLNGKILIPGFDYEIDKEGKVLIFSWLYCKMPIDVSQVFAILDTSNGNPFKGKGLLYCWNPVTGEMLSPKGVENEI